MRRASFVLLLAACSSTNAATTTDAGSSPSTPDATTETDAAVLSDASFDAAEDAAIDSPVDAGFDADDSGVGWTHFEFPDQAHPNGWLVASQGASPNNWQSATIAGATALNVFTNDPTGGGACGGAGDCSASQCLGSVCRQRVKQKSPAPAFGTGRYQWRVYVSSFNPADAQASVGAFIYADDTHELDFECGPGKNAARASGTLKHLDGSTGAASAGEMLCYGTSQANPFVSTPIAVPLGAWHVLEIDLAAGTGGDWLATWLVDGVAFETEQLTYGPAAATFAAFVSVENLAFIGETYPTARNDAYFDWFRHRAE